MHYEFCAKLSSGVEAPVTTFLVDGKQYLAVLSGWGGDANGMNGTIQRTVQGVPSVPDGGSVWVFDLVESSIPAVQQLRWRQYGEYLPRLRDDAYRDHVFAYVEKEDTPRPLLFQLDLLRHVGFAQVEVLHKNVCFAAFGAVKG